MNMITSNPEVVSAEYLKNLFCSDEFIQTNIRAGKLTERTGHETVYTVFKPIGINTYNISKVFKGNSISTEGTGDPLEKYHKALVYGDNIYRLISAHFHPNYQITPSPQDLASLDALRRGTRLSHGYDLNPIDIVGRKHDGVDLLLYQQRIDEIPDELGNLLLEDLYDYVFCNEYNQKSRDFPIWVADKMRKSGLYNAAVIRIDDSGKIDLDSKEINTFSFEARRYSINMFLGAEITTFSNVNARTCS